MAEIEQDLEVLENRLMRAWMHRDIRELKALIHGDAIMMFGTAPPVLLDRASFIGGVQGAMSCNAFRFHEITARPYGKCAWFTAHIEIEMTVGMREWKGRFLITDLWRKGALQRRWKLAERSLASVEDSREMSDAIRALQLWR